MARNLVGAPPATAVVDLRALVKALRVCVANAARRSIRALDGFIAAILWDAASEAEARMMRAHLEGHRESEPDALA